MKLSVLDRTGHSEFSTDELTVEEINQKFDELVSLGYLTYKVENGEGIFIRDFEPTAKHIIAHARMVCG